MRMTSPESTSLEHIARSIRFLRGHRVLRDSELAVLYGVETKVLNQAVRRNAESFPPDFRFQLTIEEARRLRSQIVTLESAVSEAGRGRHRKYQPWAFTEQGVAMLSSVLRSQRAILVNIEIMRAFVRLRQMLDSNAELRRKVDELEARYDSQFKVVFDAIRALMAPPDGPRKRVGFRAEAGKPGEPSC
jgi:hypothetical protein